MDNFLTEDLLIKKLNLLKETDNIYYLEIDTLPEKTKFYISFDLTETSELGIPIDFKHESTLMLRSYCLNEQDFIGIFSQFNFGK